MLSTLIIRAEDLILRFSPKWRFIDGDVERKLQELAFELPASPAPVANFVGAVRVGNLIFVSGHGPVRDGKIASLVSLAVT